MPERMTLADFDIYNDLIAARAKAEATRWGRRAFNDTQKLLAPYSKVTEEGREQAAQGEAKKAETECLREFPLGQVSKVGLGIGVRALFRFMPYVQENLTRVFVPDPPELGAPEVVEVELCDDSLATGLILPNGTYSVGRIDRTGTSVWVSLVSHASQEEGDRPQPLPSSTSHKLLPAYLISISDAGGAFWTP